MSLKTEITRALEGVAHSDVALYEAIQKVSNMPDDQKKRMAIAGVKAFGVLNSMSGHLNSSQENRFIEIFGADVARAGLGNLKELPENEIAKIGASVVAATNEMNLAGIEPSPDLFDTNVYTFFDKTPEQIAVDAKAIKQRLDARKDLNFKMRCINGEAVRVELAGKSSDEILAMNKRMNADAARRNEAEQKFSDNPIISSLDTVASVATPVVKTLEKTAKTATEFVKENPGTSIAGLLGGGALLKMISNGQLSGLELKDLIVIGALFLVGTTWMHSVYPEKFNELASQFGVDKYFNPAPSSPMFKFMEPKKSLVKDEAPSPNDKDTDKFGVSAEIAGGKTTSDTQHRKEMHESMRQLVESPSSTSVSTKPQTRSLG